MATLGTLFVLLLGYTLLILVIIFKEEINLTLASAPVLAEVKVASAAESQPVVQETINTEQMEYIRQTLGDPNNIQPSPVTNGLLPAEAHRQNKDTKFLMGL